MEIQYMVFCEKIHTKTLPPSYEKPIVNAIAPNIKNINELEFPLFISFVGGSKGKHVLRIDIITPTRTITTPKYAFNWRGGVSQGEILTVHFQPDIYGLYRFKAIVDNDVSHTITIPLIEPTKL